jgi:hypothetical protein
MILILAPLEIHMIREKQAIHMILVLVDIMGERELIVMVPSKDAALEKQFLFAF